MSVKPILQALVLADNVYEDRRTGKGIIAGIYDCLFSKEFPGEFGQWTEAFVCLTGVRGKQEIVLRYVDLADNEVLLECDPIEIEADDPLESVQFSIPVPPIPLPHPGTFAFEVHVGGELLGSLRITVLPDPEGEENEDEE